MLKIKVVIEDIARDTVEEVFADEVVVNIDPEQSKEIQKALSEIVKRIDEFY